MQIERSQFVKINSAWTNDDYRTPYDTKQRLPWLPHARLVWKRITDVGFHIFIAHLTDPDTSSTLRILDTYFNVNILVRLTCYCLRVCSRSDEDNTGTVIYIGLLVLACAPPETRWRTVICTHADATSKHVLFMFIAFFDLRCSRIQGVIIAVGMARRPFADSEHSHNIHVVAFNTRLINSDP